jgi:hypothetical protein
VVVVVLVLLLLLQLLIVDRRAVAFFGRRRSRRAFSAATLRAAPFRKQGACDFVRRGGETTVAVTYLPLEATTRRRKRGYGRRAGIAAAS